MNDQIKLNDWVYIKTFNLITKATPEILEMKNISKVPIISEYEVHTHIDNWDEVRVDFKLINKKFIQNLFPKFQQLDFIGECYKADNGLIRLCHIDNINMLNPFIHRGVQPDICLFVGKGSVKIMRNTREGHKEREDMVIDVICEELNERLQEKLKKK